MSTKTQQDAHTEEVAVSISPAGLGRITLCRDRQLNALGAAHVEALRSQLLQWAAAAAASSAGGSLSGSAVTCVLLDSNNEKAFCSGGPSAQWVGVLGGLCWEAVRLLGTQE